MFNILFWRVMTLAFFVAQLAALYQDKSAITILGLGLGIIVTAIGADILQAIKEKKLS